MRVLWIGAHPDDELFIAPYLGMLRETRRATIGFLVATRGEQGPCHRPEGCEPDLATVREAEMRAAAAVFDGEVWFADCRDGSGTPAERVIEEWSRDAGGGDALLARFRRVVDAFAPDEIFAFDPRHGSTNHADHRAAGMVVEMLGLDATLVESRLTWRTPLRVEPAVPEAEMFDASPYWHWLLRNLACHRSQFTPGAIEMFANAPAGQRRVWLLRYASGR
jgi:LmbE family N-acetylglucosaminyl deacetylase